MDDLLHRPWQNRRSHVRALQSSLFPHWRFKTPDIARKSSQELRDKFLQYEKEGDFVRMDMTKKFLQKGMTRAKRYTNYKGGRKHMRGSN